MSEPLGVFFTFTTYGTPLHAAATGSVNGAPRNWGAPRIEKNEKFERQAMRLMKAPGRPRSE